MKILLSAYACEPNKGSEPGVGWHWALALERRGYEVHVITRGNNRESIERALPSSVPRLQFHYFDLPRWARFWKYWPGGIYLYYLLWQFGAFLSARKLRSQEQFDLVHHITFVSFRQPSFMGSLGIPFIFGPVGGGESMPASFLSNLPLSARISEIIRGFGNRFVAFDPFMRLTYARAQTIVCATEETLNAIPAQFHAKCLVQRAIGIENLPPHSTFSGPVMREFKPQFLFIGRLLYWKGLHLVLRALAQVRQQLPDVRLRVIGEGPDADWLRDIARQAGVTDLVDWIPHKPQHEIWQEYGRCLGFVFPSLHDSGGMVVLEALAAGLPVICLDLGGPGSIVNSSCGFPLPAKGRSEEDVIADISCAMVTLAKDAELRASLAEGALSRAREATWDIAADHVYQHVPELRSSPDRNSNKSLIIS